MRVVKHLCSSDFETAVASMMRVELVLLAVFLQVNHSVKYLQDIFLRSNYGIAYFSISDSIPDLLII